MNYWAAIVILLNFLIINSYAIDLESLQSEFVSTEEIGPISVEKLDQLEIALKDIGHEVYFEKLQEKLGLYTLEEVSDFVHTCEMEADTLGYYRRGQTWTYTLAQEFGSDLFSSNWGNEVEKKLAEAYKIYRLERNTHYELVIEGWPIICIRPGMQFGQTLETFAHEIIHFINQPDTSINFEEIESEQDYLIKRLKQSGGEFEAYQVSAKIALELQTYDYYQRGDILRFFTEGELLDPQGLENYILHGLNYKDYFSEEYRDGLIDLQNDQERKKNNLERFKNFYTSNLDISKNNLEISKYNLGIYEYNLKYYQKTNNQIMVNETQIKLNQTKDDIDYYTKSIAFYQNLLTFFPED